MSKVAVVILNYNGSSYLQQFLPSVIQHSQEAEVIVADNASTDNSLQVLSTEFPDVRCIALPRNYGFAGGYNACLKQIEADYYLLLNSDVEVTENWLQPLINFLDSNSEFGAIQPKIKSFHQKEKFEYAGACGGFIDFLGYPYCRGRIFDHLESDVGQYDDVREIFWASGACMLVRSDLFHSVDGFDEDFFAHMEEIDLCWRLHSAEYKVACVPESIVYHVGGGTLSKLSPFKTYLNFRNGLFLLIKNLPFGKLSLKLPTRIFLDWVAALKFLLEGNPGHSLAVFRAHFSALIALRSMFGKRKKISSPPKSKLMIFEYYIKGKKTFSAI